MLEIANGFLAILQFGEFFSDFTIVLKIIVFLAILNFARNHLGNSPTSLLVVAIFSYFVLFLYWEVFGGMYLLYTLLAMGLGGVLVDFFFVSQMSGRPSNDETHGPHAAHHKPHIPGFGGGHGGGLAGMQPPTGPMG